MSSTLKLTQPLTQLPIQISQEQRQQQLIELQKRRAAILAARALPVVPVSQIQVAPVSQIQVAPVIPPKPIPGQQSVYFGSLFSKIQNSATGAFNKIKQDPRIQTQIQNYLPSNSQIPRQEYGNINFIAFAGVVLSRLAYYDYNLFIDIFNSVMSVPYPETGQTFGNLLMQINGKISTMPTMPPGSLDDNQIFGVQRINFNTMNQGLNQIFSPSREVLLQQKKQPQEQMQPQQMQPQQSSSRFGRLFSFTSRQSQEQMQMQSQQGIKFISIASSRYTEIFAVADSKTPNMIYLLFRGTSTAKTGKVYLNKKTAFPMQLCQENPDTFLYGMVRVLSELFHTIIEAVTFLATNFLGNSQPNTVKLFVTGHSLGGGLATIFAYLWQDAKMKSPYNSGKYAVLSKQIICISVGAPRALGVQTAKKFCDYVKKGDIYYIRLVTEGDDVTALPIKTALPGLSESYSHPCSSSLIESGMKVFYTFFDNANANANANASDNRSLVVRTCQKKAPFDCNNNSQSLTEKLMTQARKAPQIANAAYKSGNQAALNLAGEVHLIYLGIIFSDIETIIKSIDGTPSDLSNEEATEEEKNKGVKKIIICRLIEGSLVASNTIPSYKSYFYLLSDLTTPNGFVQVPILGISISAPAQDVKMTSGAFNRIMNSMEQITTASDLLLKGKNFNPVSKGFWASIMGPRMMPPIGCPVQRRTMSGINLFGRTPPPPPPPKQGLLSALFSAPPPPPPPTPKSRFGIFGFGGKTLKRKIKKIINTKTNKNINTKKQNKKSIKNKKQIKSRKQTKSRK